jgi:putative membrane protein
MCALAATLVAVGEASVPFVDPAVRRTVYLVITVAFFLACVHHAVPRRGWHWVAAFLAITVGGGWLIEAIGVRFGVPFGVYQYTGKFGPAVLGVPLAVPIAWSMMLYVAWQMAEGLSRGRIARCAWTGVALVAWDVFLDPQMVRDGYWTWHTAGPAWLGVPFTNFAGWFAASALMALAVSGIPVPSARGVCDPASGRHVPFALYTWTFVASAYSTIRWYGVSSPEIVATIGMGLVVCAYAWRVVMPATEAVARPGDTTSALDPDAGSPHASTQAWTRPGLWRIPSGWAR